ncbi:F-box protein At4g09920 [Lolium perenne]|uniref:F-box protein At4g09920 n=1 Tax=Lolium perenne TaxID=4522 RepID=UPI0021F58FB6|nr:F-box protein At4g09920-like [Lolium perenne]
MPPGEQNRTAPPVRAGDRIGALPDDILHHLLSFLPVQSAVRTCVLARRWRHLWRFTTGLRIVGIQRQGPVQELRKFLDHLLILRDRRVLDTVEIEFSEFLKEDVPYVNLWTRFAVLWQVRELSLHINHCEFLHLDGLPLVSQHLKTLDLHGVGLQETFLDFSSCPALEDLKMKDCEINVHKISSCALKRLSIIYCQSKLNCQARVCTPCLISLELDKFAGRTPFLENMVLLENARVDLGSSCEDFCLNYDEFGSFCGDNDTGCENCVANNDGSNECVLLGGISNATHMELISESDIFIFTRDLKRCPTFSKLKTLLLNEYWCMAPDLDPLACILKNSPILEKLSLQLFSSGGDIIEMIGSYSSVERSSAISEHLKIVEVKFHEMDMTTRKVLKFLCTFNIRFSIE